MHNLETQSIQCPYCWEEIEVMLDCSIDEQDYIEDCSVCCRPIVFSVMAEAGELVSLAVRAEDD